MDLTYILIPVFAITFAFLTYPLVRNVIRDRKRLKKMFLVYFICNIECRLIVLTIRFCIPMEKVLPYCIYKFIGDLISKWYKSYGRRSKKYVE